MLQFTPEEHELGMVRLEPFLQLTEEMNGGFHHKIEVDDDGCLAQLLLVLPHAKAVAKYLYKIIEIDSCHIKGIVYDKKEHPRRLYDKMVATYISSRTGNNEMIILAVALSHTENCQTISALIGLLLSKEDGAGMELIHSPDMIVLSDRGLAVTAAVKACLWLCFHMYCGKHLEINFMSRCGQNPLMKKAYWAAQGATSKSGYTSAMLKIAAFDQELYEWLHAIPHWRTYEVVERGCNMLHGIRSNNLSEQVPIINLQ
jgi:hypothetical protein